MLDEIQGSAEWIEARKSRIGASDACIIMRVSPYKTPFQLWQEKLGLVSNDSSGSNWAIDQGHKFEPVARAKFELATGLDIPPVVLRHDRYNFLVASLDGFHEETGTVWEHKVAGAEVFGIAKAGRVHEQYWPQVQMQLMMPGTKVCKFMCSRLAKTKDGAPYIAETVVITAYPDRKFQNEVMLPELVRFYEQMQSKTPPDLMDRDTVELSDEVSVDLFTKAKAFKDIVANDFKKSKQATELWKQHQDKLIKHVLEVAKHRKIRCAGVLFSCNKKGTWSFRSESNSGNESHAGS